MSNPLNGPRGNGGYSNIDLISEIIEEFPTMKRFLKENPDLQEQYEAYKTYEILNDKYGKR